MTNVTQLTADYNRAMEELRMERSRLIRELKKIEADIINRENSFSQDSREAKGEKDEKTQR